MAVEVWSIAWGVQLPASDKIVLLCLADFAHSDGSNAYPSVATIAERCGIGYRTVQYALRRLVEAGQIVVERPATQHSPTSYRVTPGVQPVRGAKSAGRILRRPGVQSTTSRGAADAPDPSGTVSNRQKRDMSPRPSKRCPADFVLTADLRAYAEGRGMPAGEVDDQLEAFRDHEYARAHTDWPACWRTWCRNYAKFNAPPRQGGAKRLSRDEKNAQAIANLRRKYGGEDGGDDGGVVDLGADLIPLPRRLG